jgi:hypothetical protein
MQVSAAGGLALALLGLVVVTGGCGKKGRLFEPPGAPFVLRIPSGWEVKQAEEELLVLHGPPDDEAILPVIPTITIAWHPTPKGTNISGLSLSPDASLQELVFLTGGNTSVGGGMLARWVSYSFKGDGQRVAAMDWWIQGEGCQLSCNLKTPEVHLEPNEEATRFLLNSLEMKEGPALSP